MSYRRALLSAIFSFCFLSAGQAAVIVNGGFENPIVGPLHFQSFSVAGQGLPGWTVVGSSMPEHGFAVDIIQQSYSEVGNGILQANAAEGLNSLDLTGPGNTDPTSGVQQDVSTVAGVDYLVTFSVGRAATNNGSQFYLTPSTVDLSINGGARISFTNSDATLGAFNWKEFSYTFTATGPTTTIAFLDGTPLSTSFAGLDNVSIAEVSAAVPEPASLTLWGLGALGCVICGHRRRKTA